MSKIKDYFIKNLKLILFLIVFFTISYIYNLDIQNLNYIFKKGTILEYSYSNNSSIDKQNIKNALSKLNIKYSYIDTINNKDYEYYDSDDNLVENSLLVALPILPKKANKDIFNNISNYIFDTYENSKLIDIKTLNDYYSKPYSSFLKFLGLFFTSLFVWILVLYLIYDPKTLYSEFICFLKEFYNTKKENFKKLIDKTKQNGIGYFIKAILFDDNKEDENNKNSTYKEILSTILFVLVCVIVIRYFIGELRWIPSGSMRPTILERDRVFVEKLDFPKKEIKRGDILVFYPPETKLSNSPIALLSRLSGIFCKDIAYIKRVIGLPGEKFEVKYDINNEEYRVYINDKALNEPYINSKQNWTPCNDAMFCGPFVIPENNYFMMGDNRGNSQDSRFWGFLDGSRVIGRANFMFFPIKRINLLKDEYILLNKQKINNEIKTENYIVNRYEF